MRRRLAFIVNPKSGDGRGARAWVTIERILGQDCEDAWTMFTTERIGHGIELTKTAIERGYNTIVSVGGDGTHNEVMNGILAMKKSESREQSLNEEDSMSETSEKSQLEEDEHCHESDVVPIGNHKSSRGKITPQEHIVMAIIPVGTGGDLQRTFGTHGHTVGQHLQLILRPHEHNAAPQWVDIGRVIATPLESARDEEVCGDVAAVDEAHVTATPETSVKKNERYYLNISSCGISGAICHGVNNSSKALGGFVTFFFHTAMRTILWKCKPVRWRLDEELDWRTMNLYQLVIANGKYFGGGMYVAPEAELDSGSMDVVAFRDVGVFDATLLPRMYTGSHQEYKKVFYTNAKTVTAEPNFPLSDDDVERREGLAKLEEYTVLVEADGEIVGKLPATWSVEPRSLQLLFPCRLVSGETSIQDTVA